MVKLIAVMLSLVVSFGCFATEKLSKNQVKEVEALLIEATSKLIYLDRDCDKPIDGEKVKELAKLKAFSEGYHTLEGISWENIREQAHRKYGELKMKAPIGELCEQYKADIKDNYQFLKDIDPDTVPPNLIIRMSSHMIDQGPVKQWPWTSTVTSGSGRTCPAPEQGNECGSCRACWDRSTPNVCYGKH